MKNILGLDLNLLKVFHALAIERNVTRAAQTAGLSQPAVSHALRRLRGVFQDDLFVRTPDGMEPTTKCLQLAEPVRQAIAILEDAFSTDEAFDPSAVKMTFRIGTNDMWAILLAPKLVARLEQSAPGIELRFEAAADIGTVGQGQGDAFDDLDHRNADMVLLPDCEVPRRFDHLALLSHDIVCAGNADNPALRGKLTLERYQEIPHVMVLTGLGERGRLTADLAARGIVRNVRLVVPTYMIAMCVLQKTDLVYTMPRSILPFAKEHFGLIAREVPIADPPTRTLNLVWPRTQSSNAAHSWMRDQIRDCFQEISAEIADASTDH